MKENKRYYWLKLMADFFNQPRIKKLRKIAGGDTYTIIYLKMQLLSLKTDAILSFEGIENTFAEELALTMDEDPENVKVALKFLEAQGMIEQLSETEYCLTETDKLIGSESYSAERVRRHRERIASEHDRQKALQCNADETKCNADETACNEEIEIEKEIDNNSITDVILTPQKQPKPENPHIFTAIQSLYNSVCGSYPRLVKMSEKRKKAIRARLNSGYTIEDFKRLFQMAEQSDFLKGKNGRDWNADFDWMIKDSNMPKILEGKYLDRKKEGVADEPPEDPYSARLW